MRFAECRVAIEPSTTLHAGGRTLHTAARHVALCRVDVGWRSTPRAPAGGGSLAVGVGARWWRGGGGGARRARLLYRQRIGGRRRCSSGRQLAPLVGRPWLRAAGTGAASAGRGAPRGRGTRGRCADQAGCRRSRRARRGRGWARWCSSASGLAGLASREPHLKLAHRRVVVDAVGAVALARERVPRWRGGRRWLGWRDFA